MADPLIIAGETFHSRLFIGTGKFSGPDAMREALAQSRSEMVTVALRRVEIGNPTDSQIAVARSQGCRLLPNTSGARTAEEAIRVAHLAREASGNDWLKLEVTPDPHYLLPDPIETLRAAEQLVQEGFVVLPYINADPVLAKRLEEVGTATVMPLASPIGSSQGMRSRANLEIIIEQATVPVVVDAGLGLPSHAADAMEMGADAVLVNTAIAVADQPGPMAAAFAQAVEAGRSGRLAGPGGVHHRAAASSPLTGLIGE